MKQPSMSVKNIRDTLVPITRFNKGEANKVFDEVNKHGVKIVLKSNTPVCVLVKPDQYDSMIEALEDYALFFEAEKRMANASNTGFISNEQLMSDLGITDSDLDDTEVEFE